MQCVISREDDEGVQGYANEPVQIAKLKAIANVVHG